MKKLYKFEIYIRRMGTLEGVFLADEDLLEKLLKKDIYLGECLGKHSDVTLSLQKDLEDCDGFLKLLTDDQEFIKRAVEYGLVPSGIDIVGAYHDQCYDEEQELKYEEERKKERLETRKFEIRRENI